MVFKDYMNSLSNVAVSEKRLKIREIAKATCTSELTVYAWISGRQTPNALTRKTISGVLNIPEDELFPEKPKDE